jgi:tripartite-type tricarboxylate transporter receptor subunit TctC
MTIARRGAILSMRARGARVASARQEGESEMTRRTAVGLLALLLWSAAGPACAQPANAPSGKTYRMIIGFGVGGGYDLWARAVAQHMGRHLPGNPTLVPQNMPAGGSVAAANFLYEVAPKDGTVLGLIGRDVPLAPITGVPGAHFEPTKMSWLGTPTKETNICIAYKTAPVKTVQDLYDKELVMGDVGPGSGTRAYPKALAALLGMKFKLVSGYPSSSDIFLAMERGEVQGICESLDSVQSRRPDWISSKQVSVLFQGAPEANPALQGIPLAHDLARNDQERQAIDFLYAGQGIGRPFAAPPNLPPEALKVLREAFDANMRDPEFVASVKKQRFDLDPENGEALAGLINKIYATPKPIVEKVTALVN